MKVVFGVVFAILLAVCGLVYGDNSSQQVTLTPSQMSSASLLPTPSSTSVPTPTSSSTAAPSTTTPTPSTTAAPSSTSIPTPSPTPSPPPPQKAPVYNYVNNTTGLQEFRLQGYIDVNVTFNKTVTPFQVPRNASSVLVSLKAFNSTGGNTGNITAKLTWEDTACLDCDFTLWLFLSVVWTKGSQSWQLDQIGFVFNATAHIIGTSKDLVNLTHEQQLYKTSLQRAYECSSVEIDDLKSANPNVTLTAKVHIRSFELQAFQFTDHDKFDASPLQCGKDMPDNKIVPIAVGAALALLVIIVVIAYIIGRLRNRGKKSDYEVIQ